MNATDEADNATDKADEEVNPEEKMQ